MCLTPIICTIRAPLKFFSYFSRYFFASNHGTTVGTVPAIIFINIQTVAMTSVFFVTFVTYKNTTTIALCSFPFYQNDSAPLASPNMFPSTMDNRFTDFLESSRILRPFHFNPFFLDSLNKTWFLKRSFWEDLYILICFQIFHQ